MESEKGSGTPRCAKCGKPLLAHKMKYAEVLSSVKTGVILAEQRSFYGTCPDHGDSSGVKIGHHSTALEARFRREFRKPERRYVADRLIAPEAKNFKEALHGRYVPSDEELERWRELVTKLRSDS